MRKRDLILCGQGSGYSELLDECFAAGAPPPPPPLLRRADKDGRKYLNPVPTRVGGFDHSVEGAAGVFGNRQERLPKDVLGPFRTVASVFRAAGAHWAHGLRGWDTRRWWWRVDGGAGAGGSGVGSAGCSGAVCGAEKVS